ncbi:MAG: glycosyltransferase family 4 protein [Deltaproteobacteria bacterium]|nr:glycosyltransferase family 4 protein [Deltaproteobacteria bacterium]
MRIACLIFGSLTRLGGYEIFTYNLLKGLAGKGHEVCLYLTREEYRKNEGFYRGLDFQTRGLLWKTSRLLELTPSLLQWFLAREQNRRGYDLWQVMGAYPAGLAALGLAGRTPLVLRSYGDDIQVDKALDYGLRLEAKLDKIIRATIPKMDRLVALTRTVADCYLELGAGPEKIVEIPNGLDLDRFSQATDLEEARQRWGLRPDRPMVLTLGRHHPKKGYHLIPAAARRLRQKGLAFTWLVVGQGTEALDPLIQEEGVADLVRVAGPVGAAPAGADPAAVELPADEVIALYCLADVFVLPSYLETFGRVLIEAMAAGVPVVTTDAPGCRDVVKHGVSGLLVPPGQAEELADAVGLLLGDEEQRQRLIAGGLDQVRRYDWPVVVAAYEELYRSLVSGRVQASRAEAE